MGERAITLYRAGDSDVLTGPTSFAASLSVAHEYMDNPSFGGRNLYRARVTPSAVLDIRSDSDDEQVDTLVSAAGIEHPGACTADYLLAHQYVVDALVGAGYEWVRLIDTYPPGAETWAWLYAGDEPELERIRCQTS
jgi:hypothetical protein